MGEFFWEVLEGVIGKILSIIGSSLIESPPVNNETP